MRRLPTFIVTFGILAVLAMSMRTKAQDNSDNAPPPPPAGAGQNDSGAGGPGGGPGGQAHHGGFHLLPRFVMDKLKLTDDQKSQVAQLEKDTKAKLEKILTPDQVKIMETTRPPRPPAPGGPEGQGGGPGGPNGGPDANGGPSGNQNQGGAQNPPN